MSLHIAGHWEKSTKEKFLELTFQFINDFLLMMNLSLQGPLAMYQKSGMSFPQII